MQFHQLSRREQTRVRKRLEESTLRAMEKYEVAPDWLKRINPLQAAIVDGDFDEYARLLDGVDDKHLEREAIAPGTSMEFQPEAFYYENF